MPLRTVLLLALAVLFAIFVIANWAAFMTPTSLSLLVATVEAPLGLIMLLVTGFFAAVFLAYAFYLQTSALLETRRTTRELAAQRQLADQAEASRFTELRGVLDARFDRLEDALRGGRATADAPGLAADLRAAIDQAANGLAAQIAELDDRMARR
jgi:uncharacterized integral membrane protein